jgi:uncharacterized glyoxalase superfamily protein PhnB
MSSTIIPCLRYRDAPRMIDWLCETFGFSRHLVVDDGKSGIAHAQLSLGSGMIMLGSVRDDAFGKLQGTLEPGGRVNQSPYVVVPDADAVYRRAKAQGAEIVMEIKDEDYGGRGFCCRDPEGHLWSVGTL